MVLVAGVRCSFRGKDAESADSGCYRRDRGRRIGASSAARRLSHYFAKPSYGRNATAWLQVIAASFACPFTDGWK